MKVTHRMKISLSNHLPSLSLAKGPNNLGFLQLLLYLTAIVNPNRINRKDLDLDLDLEGKIWDTCAVFAAHV